MIQRAGARRAGSQASGGGVAAVYDDRVVYGPFFQSNIAANTTTVLPLFATVNAPEAIVIRDGVLTGISWGTAGSNSGGSIATVRGALAGVPLTALVLSIPIGTNAVRTSIAKALGDACAMGSRLNARVTTDVAWSVITLDPVVYLELTNV